MYLPTQGRFFIKENKESSEVKMQRKLTKVYVIKHAGYKIIHNLFRLTIDSLIHSQESSNCKLKKNCK